MISYLYIVYNKSNKKVYVYDIMCMIFLFIIA